jgi:putative peptidoglycan lipid II flippase
VWRNIARSGLIVAGGILLGRGAGFVRELLLAHRFGIQGTADLAVFALTLPDVFTNILIGGAAGAALVPEFKAHEQSNPGNMGRLYVRSTIAILGCFGVLSCVILGAGPWVVSALAPGFQSADRDRAVTLLPLIVFAVPLTGAAAVSTAYLQARGRFALPAMGSLIFNGILIGFLLAGERLDLLAWGALAAAGVRWMVQVADAASLPKSPPSPDRRSLLTSALLWRYVQAVAASCLLLLVPVVTRALASLEGSGAVAAVNYATKLVEFPLGTVVGVLSVVMLPRFSALVAGGRTGETVLLARQGLLLTWMLAVPITLAVTWYAPAVATLIFGHGRMSPESSHQIGELAGWALLSLPAQGISALLFSLLCAAQDTVRPFTATAVGFVAYAFLAWFGRSRFGLPGLLLSGVLLHWAMAAAYATLLHRHHGLRLFDRKLLQELFLSAGAAALAFVPLALFWPVGGRPLGGFAAAAAGTLCALAPMVLLRYESLPSGIRTFYKEASDRT